KQEFGANRIKYSWITNSIPGLKQYEIEDSLFIDNNSTSFNSGKNIKFIGSQNTSIFKTKTGSPGTSPGIFNNDSVLSTVLSTIPSLIIGNDLSNSYGGFYKEGLPEPAISTFVKSIRNPELIDLTSYDTTLYITLLSNNNNIHSDILNLDYVLGNNKNHL